MLALRVLVQNAFANEDRRSETSSVHSRSTHSTLTKAREKVRDADRPWRDVSPKKVAAPTPTSTPSKATKAKGGGLAFNAAAADLLPGVSEMGRGGRSRMARGVAPMPMLQPFMQPAALQHFEAPAAGDPESGLLGMNLSRPGSSKKKKFKMIDEENDR